MAPPLGGTLNGEGASEHLDHGTVEEVLGEHGRVDGRRHEDHSDLGVGLDHVPEDHQQEVRLHRQGSEPLHHRGDAVRTGSKSTHVDVSLVDLVHDDVADSSDSSFQLPQQDTCSRRHASLLVTQLVLWKSWRCPSCWRPVFGSYFKISKLVASYPIKNVIVVTLSVLVV